MREPAQTSDHHGMAANENLQAACGSKHFSCSHSCCWWAKQIPRATWCWTYHQPIDVEANGGRSRGWGATPWPRTIHRKQSIRKRSAAHSSQDCRSVENSHKAEGCLSDGHNSSNSSSITPGFSNKDFQHSVLSSPSLTTSKMMSKWTGNRYMHVSTYLWHTIYAWHTCTFIHTHIYTYIHLYIYIHIV